MPALSSAQIAGGGAHAPNVIQTPNGIEQVNINRPSGAGVSVNTYNRFDVQQRGAILNNSPTMVQSQLGGMINGNPNFAPGQAAKVIVNQVNSASASQFNGALEVAGQRANVILANPSGISVNGGTFINTSRATLTTGTPNYAADGSVSGFNVTGGNIAISGAGLNASDVDQVDLLSRAVQANAAVYAKTNLNVVTGANSVDYNTLNATPIAGDGPAPGVSIDVSNLGGMYANRIVLVGTEAGVGISLKGITAAQSGDLVLTSAGKLVLAGQTNASGNIVASAQDIDNSGTTYAQQNAIENRDDTTATDTQATTAIYGLGKVILAGGKDANGNYTNAALIRNQSALIESAGDMELHAGQVTNTRTTMTTTGLNQPVDPALLDSLGISLSGCTSSVANGGKPDIGIKVSIGSSKSESQSKEDQTTQRGSNAQAGGTAAFVATNGDLTIAGSNVNANDVVLGAKNQVNVTS
ncbi:filamentous hemagglutinin N-terminal domain-containing protein [Paraburkholderia sp. SIMBA_027]